MSPTTQVRGLRPLPAVPAELPELEREGQQPRLGRRARRGEGRAAGGARLLPLYEEMSQSEECNRVILQGGAGGLAVGLT